MTSVIIRLATCEDATSILKIYTPIVEKTAISFETEIPTENDIRDRISSLLESHAYLVAEHNGAIIGYAYGSFFRPRKAYAKSAEVTVYIDEKHHHKGVGKLLYTKLFETLEQLGFHMALAGIALPNTASVKLHQKLGFVRVGVFKQVGHKFGKWHDVEWWQRPLTRTQ